MHHLVVLVGVLAVVAVACRSDDRAGSGRQGSRKGARAELPRGHSNTVQFCGQTLDRTTTGVECRRSPARDLTPISKLTNLKWLNLAGTKVTNLDPLGKLTNLKTLILKHMQVSNITLLSKLTNLKTLDLEITPVSDLAPLRKLKNLETLSLWELRLPLISEPGSRFSP